MSLPHTQTEEGRLKRKGLEDNTMYYAGEVGGMLKQDFYKQVHVWSGKVLATVHIGQNSVSLQERAET